MIPAKSRVAFESSRNLNPQDRTDPTGKDSDEHESGHNFGLRTGFNKVKHCGNDIETGDKDSWEKLRANFVDEMRILSKLRHPCICTVMGKIVKLFELHRV